MILFYLYLPLLESICLFGITSLFMMMYICPSFFALSLAYNKPMLGD